VQRSVRVRGKDLLATNDAFDPQDTHQPLHRAAGNILTVTSQDMPSLARAVEMGWLPFSPNGIAMCQDVGLKTIKRKGRRDERYNGNPPIFNGVRS